MSWRVWVVELVEQDRPLVIAVDTRLMSQDHGRSVMETPYRCLGFLQKNEIFSLLLRIAGIHVGLSVLEPRGLGAPCFTRNEHMGVDYE